MKRPRQSSTATPQETVETLVPIRLDLTVEGRRIKESFCWNVLETTTSPLQFATELANDLNLSPAIRDQIAENITEQIESFVPQKQPSTECRHVVRLNLRIGRVLIRDQFEWDLSSSKNSPEVFAEGLCADLGLGTDHVSTVAHSVREQLVELLEFQEKRQKCAVIKQDEVIRKGNDSTQWAPVVECLTVEEQERLERKERREARLARRNRGKADGFSSRHASTGSRRRR